MRVTLFSILLFITGLVVAYEVDNFALRYSPLKDSLMPLNAEMNRRLAKAEAALPANNCESEELYAALKGQLKGWIVGSMESYAKKAETISRHPGPEKNMYTNENLSSVGRFMLKFAGIHPSINVGGNYIGIDKLGHFIDEGFEYFEIVKSGKPLSDALKHGRELEDDLYGIKTTGVRSYADLATNYDGLRFWNSIATGPSPYFKCSGGRWKQVRSFDWSEYINSAWDEGINCNEYSSEYMTAQVERNIYEYELRDRRAGLNNKYDCPISGSECVKLQKRYASNANHVLSPSCLRAVSSPTDPAQISGQRQTSKSPAALRPSPTREKK